MIDANKIANKLAPLLEAMEDRLKHELELYTEQQIESLRRGRYIRMNTWCCNEMIDLVSRMWDNKAPSKDVIYKLYGTPVNYCPFCGTHLTAI